MFFQEERSPWLAFGRNPKVRSEVEGQGKRSWRLPFRVWICPASCQTCIQEAPTACWCLFALCRQIKGCIYFLESSRSTARLWNSIDAARNY